MHGPRWLELFRDSLVRNRLPPDAVRRLMEELSDHVIDLKEESMDGNFDVEARLGEPSQVAAAAGEQFRARSLLNRSPFAAFFTYVVLPTPLLAGTWLLCLWGVGLVLEGLARRLNIVRQWTANAAVAEAVLAACLLLSAVGLTWAYCRLSHRTGGPRYWAWSAVLLVAVLTGMVQYHVRLSEIPGQSTLTLGLGLMTPGAQQALQLLLPLAVGVALIRRNARRYGASSAG